VNSSDSGELTAVSVVARVRAKNWAEPFSTAIDKAAVDGRVAVGELGLAGDVQCDRKHHGGRDKAVYAYADEDAAWWAGELGREIPPGLFGENLRTRGLDLTGAEIGERWQIGPQERGVLVEVTSPRTPCRTFSDKMAEPRWVKRFTARNSPGAYLRVRRAGTVAAGDEVRVLHRPGHGVTVGHFLGGPEAEAMGRLMDAAGDLGLELSPAVRKAAQRAIRRSRASA
jgi:MOSC domain-containing protein YiiM